MGTAYATSDDYSAGKEMAVILQLLFGEIDTSGFLAKVKTQDSCMISQPDLA